MSSPQVLEPTTAEKVQPEGVPARYLLGLAVAVTVLLLAIVQVAIQLARSEFRRAETEAVTMTGYPQLRETRLAAEAKLLQYGVVDAGARRYRIPVDRAIDLMVNEAARKAAGPVSDEVRLTR